MEKKSKTRSSRTKRKCKYDRLGGFNPYDQAGDQYIYDHSLGEKVVRFFENELKLTKGEWEGQPFILDEWQKQIIHCLFGWIDKDTKKRRFRNVFLYVPRKNGKALAVDTPIPTPRGMVPMGDLVVGDYVFDEDSNPTAIINATDVMYGHDCYELKFSDGSKIIADRDHLWKTFTRNPWEKYGVYTTEQISKTVMHGKDRNHRLDIPGPVDFDGYELPMSPYVLGAWLGDGCSDSSGIVIGDQDESDMLTNLSKYESITLYSRRNGCGHFRIGKLDRSEFCRRGHSRKENMRGSHCRACERELDYARSHNLPIPPFTLFSFQHKLSSFGLIKNKHIPEVYMSSGIEDRLELLRGLLDTDGTISKRGRVTFTNTNHRLATQVLELCRSLGYKTTIHVKEAKISGVSKGLAYNVSFTPIGGPVLFKLARKFCRQRPDNHKKTRSKTKHIVSVRPVDSVPVRCIEVDSASHTFLAGDGYTITHNSQFVAGLAVYLFHFEKEPSNELYCAAKDSNQASVLYEMAKYMNEHNPKLDKKITYQDTKKETRKIADKTVMKVCSSDGDALHGKSPGVVIVDELHVIKNTSAIEALTTGMGARSQPIIFYVTTAGEDGDNYCNMYLNIARNVRDNITVAPSFFPVIFEKAEDESWEDEEVWARVNPSYPSHPSPEYLRERLVLAKESKAEEISFRRLYLNEQISSVATWLKVDDWYKCKEEIDESELEGERCFVAVDFAKRLDMNVVVYYFPEKRYLKMDAYIPKRTLVDGPKLNRKRFREWTESGILKIAGNMQVNMNVIRDDLLDNLIRYKVMQVAYDPFNAIQFSNDIEEAGIEVVEFYQTVKSYNMPSREFEAMVREHSIHHDNKILDWMAGHTQIYVSMDEHIKPVKNVSEPEKKVDGIQASVMAVGLASSYDPDEYESTYNESELLIL